MKVFGHPLHPLMVHFPTALLPMDLALCLIGTYRGDLSFYQAGSYCLTGGVLMGFLTLITGLTDLLGISKEEKKAMGVALVHGFVNGTVILVYAVLAWKSWKVYPETLVPGTGLMILKSLLLLTLFLGNYLGGKLIYSHHIGIPTKTTVHGKTSI